MSANYLTKWTLSVDEQQLYEFPPGMKSIQRVSIGSRSLSYGLSTIDGKKYIVLLEPVGISGIKIEVMGR